MRSVLLVIAALVAASCGVNSVEGGALSIARPDQCQDAEGITALMRSGFPIFDYDPAPDIETLVEQSDLVISGTLDSVVRIESDALLADTGDKFLTEFRIGEFIAYGAPPQEVEASLEEGRRFHIGSVWPSDDPDPLAEPVLLPQAQTRFVAFLHGTGNASAPWTFGPQDLHIWCSLDDEVQSVIDSVPLEATWNPDDLEQAIVNIVDPPPLFDFVEVPSRVLADDVAAGDPWTSRLVNGFGDANPAVSDFELDEDNDVVFEFVIAESGTCPLGPFETLQFDRNSRLLVPVFVEVERDGDCTADANPHLLMVAVARQDIPTGPFAIATSTGLPEGLEPVPFAAGELTEVGVDDIDIPILGDPAVLEVGESGLLRRYTTHCDTRFLWWEVNGQFWGRVDEGNFAVPGDWRAVERGQEVDLIITLEAPAVITAVALGAETVIRFEPVEGEFCA